MKICIIVLNFNGKKDTLECLASLKKLKHPDFAILVIDNGSKDHSLEEISAKYPDVLYLDNKQNLGFAEGNNRGIDHVLNDFEALLILNNDTIVDPYFLIHLERAVKEKPKSILGAKIYQYYNKDYLDHLGGIWNPRRAQFDLIGAGFKEDHKSFEQLYPLDYICGCALFASAQAFKDIGLFDPRFFLFWEESDLCARAKKKGYEVLVCPQAKLWHKVSASFTGGKPHTTYFWWRNRLLWMEKNLDKKTLTLLFLRKIIPEILKIYKHYLLKSLQILFISPKKKPSCFKKKTDFLTVKKAALYGVKDYCLRRFYEGPPWIFQKNRSL